MDPATLRDHVASDHQRGCQGRCYSCECGYDSKTESLLMQAADEITRLKLANKQSMAQADMRSAENVKLRQENENLRRWRALDKPLTAAMEIANSHIARLRAEFAAEARRYASHYPPSSDGRNTFVLLAEWVEKRDHEQ